MNSLLTTKQLQELLSIDRTTVYRMLKDGRLTGIKVGTQWRFSRDEVDALLSGSSAIRSGGTAATSPALSIDLLPLNCVQAIQDVFAEVVGVGTVTTRPTGDPLTEVSHSCRFCRLILASPSGRQACIASWAGLASVKEPNFAACHAGLNYAGVRIEIDNMFKAQVVAGQFYTESPNPLEEKARIKQLAKKHGLDESALQESAAEIPVPEKRTLDNIWLWLSRNAAIIEKIGRERLELINRFQGVVAQPEQGQP